MPEDLTKQYERALRKAIADAQVRIRKIYEQSIIDVSFRSNSISLKGRPFSLSLYPTIKDKVEATIQAMHFDIYQSIVESVQKSWNLSNNKNDVFVDKRLAGKHPAPNVRQILYDPNKAARDQFITRREKGLNLSGRIWNSLDVYKKELEQGLGLGIEKGKSATKLATELKQYLDNPDKLFRRVRGEDGKLNLSKAARDYHPGQGVYRSSYQNALRLTGTETNIAYRTSDHVRWQKMPFILGVKVQTSHNHPEYDICDTLSGLYPKSFKFTGWHPRCICFQTPQLVSNDLYDQIEDQILDGETPDIPDHLIISKPPESFTKYLSENSERINGWSNKPYWVKDNKQFTKGLL